jgi:hypothetical protein
MAVYKLFSTDGAGQFVKAESIDAETDDEAVELVIAKKLSVGWELYYLNRFVATNIPARRPEGNDSSS